jgi:putative sigma-54 modulation protein
MRINVKGTNIELTDSIRDYVEKRVTNLGKLLQKIEESGGEVNVHFEVGKTSNHHKKGEYFHTDCLINLDGKKFYHSADAEDLYAAVDALKESLFVDIQKYKDRKQTLLYRGARSVKKMMKGLSKRNPFTSKY